MPSHSLLILISGPLLSADTSYSPETDFPDSRAQERKIKATVIYWAFTVCWTGLRHSVLGASHLALTAVLCGRHCDLGFVGEDVVTHWGQGTGPRSQRLSGVGSWLCTHVSLMPAIVPLSLHHFTCFPSVPQPDFCLPCWIPEKMLISYIARRTRVK